MCSYYYLAVRIQCLDIFNQCPLPIKMHRNLRLVHYQNALFFSLQKNRKHNDKELLLASRQTLVALKQIFAYFELKFALSGINGLVGISKSTINYIDKSIIMSIYILKIIYIYITLLLDSGSNLFRQIR